MKPLMLGLGASSALLPSGGGGSLARRAESNLDFSSLDQGEKHL